MDEDYMAMNIHELEMLDECHKDSFNHMRSYKNHMSTRNNKKLHPRESQVSDLVITKNSKNKQNWEQKGNFQPY